MELLDTHGFPAGYFVIQSVATNRLLDVAGDSVEDGTEVLLWPAKETSLVESFRDPDANNQVFFIDTSGALCSRSSGHAIDVEGDRLVLRHRRPISLPYPNPYSHPLPKFSYNAQTGEITVHFKHDPTYPPVSSSTTPSPPVSQARTSSDTTTSSTSSTSQLSNTSGSWMNKTYLLVSQPLRKPRTIIDDASEILTTAISSPFNFINSAFGGQGSAGNFGKGTRPEEVFDGNIDLKEDEVVDEERGEEGEVDNSPEMGRKVRVIGVLRNRDGEEGLSSKARLRRQWKVTALRRMNAKTDGHVI